MKTNKGNKNMGANGSENQHEHPGRPRYEMQYPLTLTFTFTELMDANGVDTHKYAGNGHKNKNFGKGENATMLTIRKNLKYELASEVKLPDKEILKKTPSVYLMKGYTSKPVSDGGLGRRGLLYRLASTPFATALVEAKVRGAGGLTEDVTAKVKATRKTRKAVTAVDTTAAVDKTIADAKAILAEPASTVTIPAAPSVIPDAIHNPLTPAAETVPVAPATPADVVSTVSVPIAVPSAPVAEIAHEAAPVVSAETAPL